MWLGVTPSVWVALVWAAHIGVDRAVGYGLKYPTGFKHTHLSATAHERLLQEAGENLAELHELGRQAEQGGVVHDTD